ncbi:hypothetical protein B296_00009020 [Ensete ventricosum]|uniref:Uncharacterized protein n=1 Tax=Ensete ventricosum TaxID=4639 RepID=A0A426YYY3_ENSVE|nr:hypothetical protein B296_00009020 [Ensete ventricosum]
MWQLHSFLQAESSSNVAKSSKRPKPSGLGSAESLRCSSQGSALLDRKMGPVMVNSNMTSNVAPASRPRYDSATSTQRLPPDLTSGYPLTALWPTNCPPVNEWRSRADVPDQPPQLAPSGMSGKAQ